MNVRRVGAAMGALALLLAACGDDDDESTTDTTETTEATDDTATDDTTGDGEFAELCALAEEMAAQEDFPTEEQLTQYRELAPEEISGSVDVAAEALLAAGDDLVASIAAVASDDVEQAVFDINAFETAECGIEHEDPPPGPEEAAEGTAAVEVTAIDYGFELPEAIAAGPTSFVMRNDGQEAHFMLVTQIAEGHTLDEALAFDGDPEEAGLVVPGSGGESGLAAPGGEDIEVLTTDLAPGNWAMLCFIPTADGTPHAFQGMAVPFTVS